MKILLHKSPVSAKKAKIWLRSESEKLEKGPKKKIPKRGGHPKADWPALSVVNARTSAFLPPLACTCAYPWYILLLIDINCPNKIIPKGVFHLHVTQKTEFQPGVAQVASNDQHVLRSNSPHLCASAHHICYTNIGLVSTRPGLQLKDEDFLYLLYTPLASNGWLSSVFETKQFSFSRLRPPGIGSHQCDGPNPRICSFSGNGACHNGSVPCQLLKLMSHCLPRCTCGQNACRRLHRPANHVAS